MQALYFDNIMNEKGKLIEKWFQKGIEAAQRQNKSGCCCRFDENDNIIELCAAHKEYFEKLFQETIDNYMCMVSQKKP